MTPDTEARLVAVLERLEQRLAAPLAAERRLATLEEAEELLGVKRSMVFRLVRRKAIVRVLVGRNARFDVDSIERYIAGEVAAAAPRRGPGRPRGSRSKVKSAAEVEAEKIARIKA